MITGSEIRRLRFEAGISQRTLAAEVGVTPGYLCSLEKGNTNPNTATAQRVFFTVSALARTAVRQVIQDPEEEPRAGIQREARAQGVCTICGCSPTDPALTFQRGGVVCHPCKTEWGDQGRMRHGNAGRRGTV